MRILREGTRNKPEAQDSRIPGLRHLAHRSVYILAADSCSISSQRQYNNKQPLWFVPSQQWFQAFEIPAAVSLKAALDLNSQAQPVPTISKGEQQAEPSCSRVILQQVRPRPRYTIDSYRGSSFTHLWQPHRVPKGPLALRQFSIPGLWSSPCLWRK